MKRDNKVFLQHILESLEKVKILTKRLSKEKFLKSWKTQDVVVRRLEIIGEAAKNVSSDLKEKHADVPWKKLSGLRDILIHQYFDVDLDTTWEIVIRDLPKLKKEIEKILENAGN